MTSAIFLGSGKRRVLGAPGAILGVLMILLAGISDALAVDNSLELVLVAPQGVENRSPQAGERVVFSVLFTNPSSTPVLVSSYGKLGVRVVGGNHTSEVTALMVKPLEIVEQKISGHGFLKQEYGFDLPGYIEGPVSIELTDHSANKAMFHARASGPTEPGNDPGNQESRQASLEDLTADFQPFLKNLSTYKPVYFLFGVDPGLEKTRFQISFKYRLFDFNEAGFLKENLSVLEKIHLGYTQQSFWDLESDSAPFKDSRYMPDFFFLQDKIDLNLPWVSGFGFQTGFQHESNGRDGVDSRSTNYAYLQPIITFHPKDTTYLIFSPKVWTYLGNDNDTNPDLEEYRGYFDLEAKIGNPKGLALGTLYRQGKKGITWQGDLSYPINQLPLLNGFLDVYLHAQYFSGYAENLLEYNQRNDVFRLGFSIVR